MEGACSPAPPTNDLFGEFATGAIGIWDVGYVLDGEATRTAGALGHVEASTGTDILRIGTPVRNGSAVSWVTRNGDAFVAAEVGSRLLGSGIVDLADQHALVDCTGTLLIDGFAVAGVSDARRVVKAGAGYLVLTGANELLSVDATTYVATTVASGVSYLEHSGLTAVWVDGAGQLHLDGSSFTVDDVRIGTAVTRNLFTVGAGACGVRPDHTTFCNQPGVTYAVDLPVAVASEVVEMMAFTNDVAGNDPITVFARTHDGSVWAWDWQQGALFTPPPPSPPRHVAGPP